jgi:hypothetical protein
MLMEPSGDRALHLVKGAETFAGDVNPFVTGTTPVTSSTACPKRPSTYESNTFSKCSSSLLADAWFRSKTTFYRKVLSRWTKIDGDMLDKVIPVFCLVTLP